ncbi:hypothetical protein WJX81_008143 [Elliptochloris bilobata]|uniref:U-box domain-containing protein n=1 Tax=Elliptochloris bilobata TaxID=381761 RepID=A0AAW1RZB1_9CHLO
MHGTAPSAGASTAGGGGGGGSDADDSFSLVAASDAASLCGDSDSEDAVGAAHAASLRRAAAEAADAVGEDHTSAAWRAHRKHIFVLTNAGRPVWTLHGREDSLVGFMAIVDAMLAFAKSRGDAMRSIRAGQHVIVFLERGPLYLVAVAATGEPAAALAQQLDLLHAHLLAILTNGFDRTLTRNPRFEPRRLLGGTEDMLRGFVHSFETDPSAMLGAFAPLPLPAALRHSALVSLQVAVKAAGALYGLLLAGELVAALAQPRAQPLDAADLLLLGSFVRRTGSFRAAPESFSPVCLPRYNASAFLHAYVAYLQPEAEVCLVLLATQADAFFSMSEAAAHLKSELGASGFMQAVAAASAAPSHGRLRLPDLPAPAGGGPAGTTPLQHFLYRSPARGQFIAPAFTTPLDNLALQRAVVPAYARAHAAVWRAGAGGAPALQARTHYFRDGDRVVLAYAGPEYGVFALFDALVELDAAAGRCLTAGAHPETAAYGTARLAAMAGVVRNGGYECKENKQPTDHAGSGLAKMFKEGADAIGTHKTEDLFKQLETRSLTKTEEEIIQQRVAHQRKMFEEYEKRERRRKVEAVQSVCPDVTDAEAVKALELCNDREDEAAAQMADSAFLRRVRAECGAPAALASGGGGSAGGDGRSGGGRKESKSWPAKPGCARPKRVDSSTLGDSVFVGSFRGKGFGPGGAAGPPRNPAANPGAPAPASVSKQEAKPTAGRSRLPRARAAKAEPKNAEPEPDAAGDGGSDNSGDAGDAVPEDVYMGVDDADVGAAVMMADDELASDAAPATSAPTLADPTPAAAGALSPRAARAARGRAGAELAGSAKPGGAAAALEHGTPPPPSAADAQMHTLVRMLSDGTERPATDSEVSRVRHGIADASPQAPAANAAAEADADGAGAAGPSNQAVGQAASDAAAAPALAAPAAGAAVGALTRLPQAAALKFLRQMRPGVADATLAALQDVDASKADSLRAAFRGAPACGRSMRKSAGLGQSDQAPPDPHADPAQKPRADDSEEDAVLPRPCSPAIRARATRPRSKRFGSGRLPSGGTRNRTAHAAPAASADIGEGTDGSAGSNGCAGAEAGVPVAAAEGEVAAAVGAAADAGGGRSGSGEDASESSESKKVRQRRGSGGGRRAAISRTGHTNRGRVRQKSHKSAELLDIGQLRAVAGWYNAGYIFPLGFKSRVHFRSSVVLDAICVHECVVLGRGGKFWPAPTFQVTAMDRPGEPLIAKSCTGCWTGVLKRINAEIEARRRAGEDLPPAPKTAIAGPEYFGFNQPEIVDGIEALDPGHECAEYWHGKAHREAAAAGLPAPERGAPRVPRPPGARGGRSRGKRRRDESDNDDGEGGEEEGDGAEAMTNRWSGVDRARRYRSRNGGEGGEPDEGNPLPKLIDPITLEPVVTPAISPFGHVMGLATWKACLKEHGVCPFTKAPLSWEQCTVLTLHNIERFRDRIK